MPNIAYKNNLIFPWPSFSLWNQEKGEGGYGQ